MHKTAFIVPASLRTDLSGYLQALKDQIERKNPSLNYEIIVVRQTDEGPLNEGWLCNVGYQASDAAYYVFHPTDQVPTEDADYSQENAFVQMGYVQLCTAEIFEEVNGFSNGYPGTHVHISDLYERIHKARILMFRRNVSCGELPQNTEEHSKALKRLNSGYDRSKDGLSSLVYHMTSISGLTGVNGKEIEVTSVLPTTQAPAVAEEPSETTGTYPGEVHTYWRTRGDEDVQEQR